MVKLPKRVTANQYRRFANVFGLKCDFCSFYRITLYDFNQKVESYVSLRNSQIRNVIFYLIKNTEASFNFPNVNTGARLIQIGF